MCKTCKCVWVTVIVLASVYLLYDWYDNRFCDDVVVPTLCSK